MKGKDGKSLEDSFFDRFDELDELTSIVMKNRAGIRKINESEYLAIVVSNQPVIARGECSFEEVDEMFKKIETLLGNKGVFLDGIYYCPHHPHSGYEGEVKELKITCDCRKPAIGLLKQAEEKFNLDLRKCYMIGDSNLDMKTAQNANIPAIRVKSDLIEEDCCYGKMVDTLSEAIDIIIDKK
jgi:D-glycero-D-manno-heptose 1,7-bisphosphate phosphatase